MKQAKGLRFEVLGDKELELFLLSKKNKTNGYIQEELKQVATYLEKEVKESISGKRAEKTSVDTGRFMNSVKGIASKDNAIIMTELDYPLYLEYGTSRIQARPHFRNSMNRNKDKVLSFLKDAVAKALR
jgi:hypothetical protein